MAIQHISNAVPPSLIIRTAPWTNPNVEAQFSKGKPHLSKGLPYRRRTKVLLLRRMLNTSFFEHFTSLDIDLVELFFRIIRIEISLIHSIYSAYFGPRFIDRREIPSQIPANAVSRVKRCRQRNPINMSAALPAQGTWKFSQITYLCR